MSGILMKDIVSELNLETIAGHKGLEKIVKAEMISRPGVELAGFLAFFDSSRIVLIGSKENSFLETLSKEVQEQRVESIFKLSPPGFIFSVNVNVSELFIRFGNQYNIPILRSSLRTTPLNSKLYSYLHTQLSPRISMHGVLLDIYGLGTLITGKSGIGKSEVALELIKRGHILISDDRVDVYEAVPGVIVGQAPKILERYMEIRGIGIVDVMAMFGAGSYRENKKIRLVVELEHWKKEKNYDRLGIENETIKIFSSDVAKITIPILPGRNVATLVESAAMNQKLKYFGFNAALNLTKEVSKAAKRDIENE